MFYLSDDDYKGLKHSSDKGYFDEVETKERNNFLDLEFVAKHDEIEIYQNKKDDRQYFFINRETTAYHFVTIDV